ncbi:MAG: two pore domain potassium channel family protein [Alphaproteobacteria bacterium]|nr:two pore domain potassium channel family protein [Alphaproteobacteria bacterium]
MEIGLFQNLIVGSGLVALSVVIHTAGLIAIAGITPPLARHMGLHSHDVGRTVVMTGTVLGILALLTVEVWAWALAYRGLGATDDFADALYLSTAMFSTTGYAGMTIDPHWRLLTVLEGINGFLLIGLSTAFLVRASVVHGPFQAEKHF